MVGQMCCVRKGSRCYRLLGRLFTVRSKNGGKNSELNGSWKRTKPEEVKEGVAGFLEAQFKNVHWRRPSISGLPLSKLSANEKASLEEPFSKEEMRVALASYDGNKTPGPNGFSLEFIKINWEQIRGDFMVFLDKFHRYPSIVKELNKSFIALIPKCAIPSSMKDYKAISLVSSLYKILFKVLVNRTRKVLSSVIGVTQMAFVKNRKAEDINLLRGIVFDVVQVSHLQFADDTIMFIRPKVEYITNVRRILKCFELASGLRLNFRKSCVVRIGKGCEGEPNWAAT
ncbi:hypothetical protein Ddye_011313 [Dipteronia dyeriana]|uniref:Reverse transcriptase domain-containing protein n=1 Tax=Dipteronia dyeriana TaxID=168575 RepID=A0AAD9X2A1_9ROSI|nr:hypothetical protein Ddye_011313 [Dipteronia dyeriana]